MPETDQITDFTPHVLNFSELPSSISTMIGSGFTDSNFDGHPDPDNALQMDPN